MSAPSSEIWRPGDQVSPHDPSNTNIHSPEVFATIERGIDSLDKELRELSLDISGLNRPPKSYLLHF